ncbi:MAG: hypothetical protein KF745_07770 [Phycisphaeraceae bacterium]|nr:hypothetical protein [Phycisphaeraceae bacterium]
MTSFCHPALPRAGAPPRRSHSRRPPILSLLAPLLAVWLIASTARAQSDEPPPTVEIDAPAIPTPAASPPDRPSLLARFPSTDRPIGRWLPVVVSIQGGTKPFDGVLRIEFTQTSSRTAAVVTRVAATPGRISDYTVAINPSPSAGRIAFSLIDSRGEVARVVYSTAPDSTEMQLPLINGRNQQIAALCVGPPGGIAASVAPALELQPVGIIASQARAPSIGADALPGAWAAYDSLRVLIVEAESAARADPRALAAIHEWVSSGGRLIIIASRPGREWRSWLPPAPFGSVVTIDEPADLPTPRDLAGVAAAVRPRGNLVDRTRTDRTYTWTSSGYQRVYGPVDLSSRTANTLGSDSTDPAHAPADPAAAAPTPVPSPSVTARIVRITPAGREFGWRTRWTAHSVSPDEITVQSPELTTGDGAAGLIAEGPVGFGFVTIVGVDPRRCTTVLSEPAIKAVWESILRPAVVDSSATAASQWGGYAVPLTESARSSVLDSLSDVPTVGPGAFRLIIVAMVLLALLLGPIDAFILGRLSLRHRSWISALLWISIASIAAYQFPLLARSTECVVNRVRVIDALFPAHASVGPTAPGASSLRAVAPGSGAATPLAWQTGLTGFFAGSTLSASFTGDRIGSSWWRCVVANDENYWGIQDSQRDSFGGAIPFAETVPDLASLGSAPDPWGGWPLVPNASGLAGAPLAPTTYPLWTFHTFEDRSRTLPPFDVRLSDSVADGATPESPLVVLSNLPEDATLVWGALRTANAWSELTFNEPTGATRTASLARFSAVIPTPWALPENLTQGYYYYYANQNRAGALPSLPGVALQLTGPDTREQAVSALLATGRWAAVYASLDHAPDDMTLSVPAQRRTRLVLRAVIPIPESLIRSLGDAR